MTKWVLVSWGKTLFEAFNRLSPSRAKNSDGSIGDKAHQAAKSGHNPDDTPGSKPEREDTDSLAEVRAVDITAFPGMEAAVQSILRSPEKDALIYIIYRRRIWQKANGWKEEAYHGDDPHDGHAHFSGDPRFDNAAVTWNSVLGIEDDMSQHSDQILEAWRLGTPTTANGDPVEPVQWRIRDESWQAGVNTTLATLASHLTGLGGLTADDRTAIDRLTNAVNELNSRLASP